ncbi:MAG: phospholipase D-like domain-containing protein, partial [Acidimicrobiales bacterium]|nr:phospholipase D-like domain-containing protein [Acidimicrobiales bacterium]
MADSDGLFIVDNRDPEHSGLHYLRQWCEHAKSFDIATGYFEIGALLELDGHWKKLDKIRILMGDEVTHRTKRALLEAVRSRAEVKLDESLETDKHNNPFLNGVDAIIAAIQSGQIECKVYNRDKFHAKTYITHGNTDVIGSFALVGSSNFTCPGLSQNVELNIRATSAGDVQDLQQWFEKHWDDAEDINDDILRVIQRHAELFTPFDVYSRALHEMFHGRDITAEEWEQSKSLMF